MAQESLGAHESLGGPKISKFNTKIDKIKKLRCERTFIALSGRTITQQHLQSDVPSVGLMVLAQFLKRSPVE